MELGDVVLSTGGIGPTADDLTTETIARLTGKKLWRHEPSVDHMRRLFESLGRVMPENNIKQALFPETAEVIIIRSVPRPAFAWRSCRTIIRRTWW